MPTLHPTPTAKRAQHQQMEPEKGPVALPTAASRQRFAQELLAWYAQARRDLPWRQSRDPYAIWVSEIMLQQTQVATVRGYFARWLERFPTVRALAEAKEGEVLLAWQGLGYYSRARNLHKAAQQVVAQHGGKLPSDLEALQALPGIGRYSAGAIASIAFNLPAPIVDGNVIRLLCRYFGLHGDPTRAPLKALLWRVAAVLIPEGQAHRFNQALMEMGALCCTPKRPLCAQCPLSKECYALKHEATALLPETPARPTVTHERHVALLAERAGAFLIEQRPTDSPRWAGLWQFPNAPVAANQTLGTTLRALAAAARLSVGKARERVSMTHSVTRYRIDLVALHCSAEPIKSKAPSEVARRWVTPAQLSDYALPAPHARIAAVLRDGTATKHPKPTRPTKNSTARRKTTS